MILQVESGRVLILPVKDNIKFPMISEAYLSRGIIKNLAVMLDWKNIENKPGTKEGHQFFIGSREFMPKGYERKLLKIHSPRIMIVDLCFFYQKIEKDSDSYRALKACEGLRRFGTFRLMSGDMGASFRTGRRRCSYELREFEQGIAGKINWYETDEVYESPSTEDGTSHIPTGGAS
jgi:hypothetical protein